MPIKGKAWKNCARLLGLLEAQSQLPIRFAERNDAPNVAGRIHNANLARAKTGAADGVVDCLLSRQKYRLDAGRFKALPAVSCGLISTIVIEALCVCNETSISVLLNMSEQNNGQTPQVRNPEAVQGFTAERVLRTRPRTYRAIVQLLADPHASVNQIAKLHRVSTHTVRAIRHREAQGIAERKKSLAAMLANVAELGAARMEEKIGKAPLRDAAIATGIATDKMLALTGQLPPTVQIANVVLPTPEQDEARRRIDHALDEITRLLKKRGEEALSENEELMLKAQCRFLKITRELDSR